MKEKCSSSSPENNFHGRLSEGMLTMMNFEATILGHKPPQDEDDFDPEGSIIFARKIEKNRALFDSIFTDRHFHPAAAFPNIASLVQVSLLTAPQIIMNNAKNRKTSYKREFSFYNSTMRDAIRVNPDMTKEALIAILEASAEWAKVPRFYLSQTRGMYNKVINGASEEVIASQLLASKAAQDAGIQFEESSIREDLGGTDVIVTLPGAKNSLRIDLKSNPLDIDSSDPIGYGSPRYEILSPQNNIRLYTGAGDVLRNGRLQLDQEDIEHEAVGFVHTLQEIAEKIEIKDEEEMPALLAQLAMRFSK